MAKNMRGEDTTTSGDVVSQALWLARREYLRVVLKTHPPYPIALLHTSRRPHLAHLGERAVQV